MVYKPCCALQLLHELKIMLKWKEVKEKNTCLSRQCFRENCAYTGGFLMEAVKESSPWIRLQRSGLRYLECLLSMIPIWVSFSREIEHWSSCWKRECYYFLILCFLFHFLILPPSPSTHKPLVSWKYLYIFLHSSVYWLKTFSKEYFEFSYTCHMLSFFHECKFSHLLGAYLL